ncbi:MAG: gliding motility lipoprotein GldH [Bacteroidales bacterium]|nr:gliding motility lipoprotein GldH [Bacteroidales bacterium]
MKTNKIILLTALGLCLGILAACGNKVCIDETHNFNNNTWMRFEPEVFNFDVKDIDAGYNVIVTLRYDTAAYPASTLPLVVDYFSDTNELRNYEHLLRLVQVDGKRRGETLGGYCTVMDTIDAMRVYNRKGTYTYRIKQATSKYEINGFSSLTFKVERAAKI